MKSRDENFRYDILTWWRGETGQTYDAIAIAAGLSRNTVYLVHNGETDPTASTLKSIFVAVGLKPEIAMNFKLPEPNARWSKRKMNEFRRAVVEAAR